MITVLSDWARIQTQGCHVSKTLYSVALWGAEGLLGPVRWWEGFTELCWGEFQLTRPPWTKVCRIRVHEVNEGMEGTSSCRAGMGKCSWERNAALIWGRTNHLPWLLTCSGVPGELWFPTTLWIKHRHSSEKEESHVDSREIRSDLIGMTFEPWRMIKNWTDGDGERRAFHMAGTALEKEYINIQSVNKIYFTCGKHQ